jgi:hypothetical protein
LEIEGTNESRNLTPIIVETGATIASLILFPAIAQSLRISPVVTKALNIALNSRGGK